MTDPNQRTIEVYEAYAQTWSASSSEELPSPIKKWLTEALSPFPTTARILEIGGAYGRDADYIESLGYRVERTDAAQAFVDLQKQRGHAASQLNVITDELNGPYDLVIANAVLVHFTREETALTLKKVRKALNDGGTFAFSVPRGTGEQWLNNRVDAERYFCYWTDSDIDTLVRDAGFTQESTADCGSDSNWIAIIARKISPGL